MAEKAEIETTTQNEYDLSNDEEHTAALRSGKVKADIFVSGLCMIYYLLSFLDKANLGNAKVAGLTTDLNMSSFQYSLALTLLYIPYILVEMRYFYYRPANLLLKRIGANILLPGLTFCFGLISFLQGFIHNYAGLVVCRMFLGAAEGGLVPAIVLYMSTFYRADEFQLRASFLFAFAALAGAFSGLLAAGIEQMDGLRGRPGWAWIFILEGVFTCLFAILTAFLLAPSIEKAHWLNEKEKRALIADFEASGRGAEREASFNWAEVWDAFKSPLVWMYAPMFLFNGLILFGLAYFQPTIVASLGYSSTQTQLRSVPPYAVVFVVALVLSYFADKYKQRGLYISFMGILASIGYIINLAASENKNARYAALFFSTFGGYGASPALSAWLVDNIAPHYKRGTAIALCFIATQIGGIISTWIYPSSEAPEYHPGSSVSLTAALIVAIAPIVIVLMLRRANKLRAQRREELGPEMSSPIGPMNDKDIRYEYIY